MGGWCDVLVFLGILCLSGVGIIYVFVRLVGLGFSGFGQRSLWIGLISFVCFDVVLWLWGFGFVGVGGLCLLWVVCVRYCGWLCLDFLVFGVFLDWFGFWCRVLWVSVDFGLWWGGCLRGFTAAGGFCDLYMLVVFDFRVFCVVSWHNICFCVFVRLVSDSE